MSIMQQALMCDRQPSAVVRRLHTELHMCTCLLQCTLPAALSQPPRYSVRRWLWAGRQVVMGLMRLLMRHWGE